MIAIDRTVGGYVRTAALRRALCAVAVLATISAWTSSSSAADPMVVISVTAGGLTTVCDTNCTDCTPGSPAVEACNGLDDDCDGTLPADEADADGDGVSTCEGDCDDAVATSHPGAPEVCDSLDNDCNGVADDGADVPTTCGDGICGSTGVMACVGGVLMPESAAESTGPGDAGAVKDRR